MITKQTIAIIGAAGKLADTLAKGNYRILLCSDKENDQYNLVDTITQNYPSAEVEAVSCPMDASWEADIIVLSVPGEDEKQIAEKIREVANQKLVIRIGDRHNDLSKLLPNSRIVNIKDGKALENELLLSTV
jgi:8-hydroxy-5-deazaflavin:NADPH oxidoreductase